jgi:hypothetical protein
MRLVSTTQSLEEILSDAVGTQPEMVRLKDWAGIARRIEMLLEMRGLRIAMTDQRPRPTDLKLD